MGFIRNFPSKSSEANAHLQAVVKCSKKKKGRPLWLFDMQRCTSDETEPLFNNRRRYHKTKAYKRVLSIFSHQKITKHFENAGFLYAVRSASANREDALMMQHP